MDKKTYFNNLHETLAEKYGVNKNWIGYLRQKRINLFRTQNQIIERLQEKLIRVLDEHDQEGIAICRKKLDFVKNLTYAQFEEITRKTEYDK